MPPRLFIKQKNHSVRAALIYLNTKFSAYLWLHKFCSFNLKRNHATHWANIELCSLICILFATALSAATIFVREDWPRKHFCIFPKLYFLFLYGGGEERKSLWWNDLLMQMPPKAIKLIPHLSLSHPPPLYNAFGVTFFIPHLALSLRRQFHFFKKYNICALQRGGFYIPRGKSDYWQGNVDFVVCLCTGSWNIRKYTPTYSVIAIESGEINVA